MICNLIQFSILKAVIRNIDWNKEI